MPAYWVARAKVTDPVAYKKYTDQVPGILARYDGKVLARGGRYQIMEGRRRTFTGSSSSSFQRWSRVSPVSSRRNTRPRPPSAVTAEALSRT